jgi:hypothetical protein
VPVRCTLDRGLSCRRGSTHRVGSYKRQGSTKNSVGSFETAQTLILFSTFRKTQTTNFYNKNTKAMKLYSLIHYGFTGLEYPGIEYIDCCTKTEEEFELFLKDFVIRATTFSSSGQVLHHQLKNSLDFYNGLYQDIRTQKQYIICCNENINL